LETFFAELTYKLHEDFNNGSQEALAEGQYLVLYNKDQVIGSGEIRLK
jgi:tRNA U34 2-thiouridine synthase MnmA/TrmU